jgi:hypothetical protein
MTSEAGPPRVMDSPNLPRDTRVKATLVARSLLTRQLPRIKYCHRCFVREGVHVSWSG